MQEFLRFVRSTVFLALLAGLVWLAAGLRWPGFSDPNGDWFRLVSQLSATLLGAFIAGGVTWHFAEKKRRDEQRASLQRMFLRLLYVNADLSNLLRMIDEMLVEANAKGNLGLPFWARVRPIVGLAQPKVLDVTDLAPLFDMGEAELVNDVMLLNDRYESNMAAASTYNDLRLELRSLMKVDAKTAAGVSVAALSDEEFKVLSPRFDELNELAKDLTQHLRSDVPFARDIITRYSVAAKKTTGAFPRMEFIDHASAE